MRPSTGAAIAWWSTGTDQIVIGSSPLTGATETSRPAASTTCTGSAAQNGGTAQTPVNAPDRTDSGTRVRLNKSAGRTPDCLRPCRQPVRPGACRPRSKRTHHCHRNRARTRWSAPGQAGDARHHVVADVHPTPPGVVDRNAGQRRKLARDRIGQQLAVRRIVRVGSGDRAAAAQLQTVVGQQAVVETQRAGVSQKNARFEIAGLEFGIGERTRDDRVRQNRHDLVLEPRMELLSGVATGTYCHPLGTHDAAGRAQMVHAADRLPALHRAAGMYLGTQRARLLQQAEGELQRMDTDAVRLEHRAHHLTFVAIVAPHFFGAEHAGLVAESVAQQGGLALKHRNLLGPMRQIEVTTIDRVTVDLRRQVFEVLEAGANLGVEPFGHIQAVTLDPLRAGQAAARVLALAATAARTAPDALVGLQHHRLYAVFLGQVQGGRDSGGARSDDGHVDIDVGGDGTVIRRRCARAGDPVGRCIRLVDAGVVCHQWVVTRVISLARRRTGVDERQGLRHGHAVCSLLDRGSAIGRRADWGGPCETHSSS